MSYSGDLMGGDFSKFNDREDRMGFVRKVYGILGFQLALSAAIIAIPVSNDKAAIWMNDHWGLLLTAMIMSLVICCTMICFLPLTRIVPVNYILMTAFTLCEAYMLAAVASRYNPEIVI